MNVNNRIEQIKKISQSAGYRTVARAVSSYADITYPLVVGRSA